MKEIDMISGDINDNSLKSREKNWNNKLSNNR